MRSSGSVSLTNPQQAEASAKLTPLPAALAKPAFIFCLLAYAFSWLWWGIRFMPYLPALLTNGQPINRAALGPLDVSLGMAGPLLAALVMRLFVYKESLRGSLGLKRSWRIYALAFILPTSLGIAAIAFNHLTGLARFDWAGDHPLSLLPGQLLITLLAALTAIGEEYGWRGYLLPRLMTLGSARATLISGLVWGFWHLPLLFTGLTYPGLSLALAIPGFLLSVTMLSGLFTWFYQHSGSVMVAALVHGSLNALSELTSARHIPAGSPLLTQPFGLITAVLALAAALLLSRGAFPRPPT